jgi:uncharacterized protein
MAINAFEPGKLHVAVVTGQHPFDVPGFAALWRALPGIDAYIQHMDDYVADTAQVRQLYDIVVFYNFHQATPSSEGSEGRMKAALEDLGATSQGIVVLHHALLAFRQWPLWSEIVGVSNRGFGYYPNQALQIQVAAPHHPITHDLDPWEMVDETYTMDDAGAGNEVLLTTDHPRSMRTIAWTRAYRQARVFCYESGHDNVTYANAGFRLVLARGIQWAAGRL